MSAIPVRDLDDPRVSGYRRMAEGERLAADGVFVAEGRLVVGRLLTESRMTVRSVMVTEPARVALEEALETQSDVPVYVVPQALMNDVTGFNIHRGCLAIGVRPSPADWRTLAATARRLVVLERIANADNVGSIFRSAAAFGADAVLLGPDCADPLYRKAIRTSMGAALIVPFASLAPWPASLHALRATGHALVALAPAATRALCEVVALVGDRSAALVLGHEGEGLTAAALDACDLAARIPIDTRVDSLNVATAAAIALYELQRATSRPTRS